VRREQGTGTPGAPVLAERLPTAGPEPNFGRRTRTGAGRRPSFGRTARGDGARAAAREGGGLGQAGEEALGRRAHLVRQPGEQLAPDGIFGADGGQLADRAVFVAGLGHAEGAPEADLALA
jgi:hypothetical protein